LKVGVSGGEQRRREKWGSKGREISLRRRKDRGSDGGQSDDWRLDWIQGRLAEISPTQIEA
jgi:hypothetical protein